MKDYPELNMKERIIITKPSSIYLFIYLHNINKLHINRFFWMLELFLFVSCSQELKHNINNLLHVLIQVRTSSGNRDVHYADWTIVLDRFTDEDLLNISDVSSK